MTPVEERIDHAQRRLRQFVDANRHEGRSAVFSHHRLYFADIEALLTEHSAREKIDKTALREMLGSDEALARMMEAGDSRPFEQVMQWDGPICARRALDLPDPKEPPCQ